MSVLAMMLKVRGRAKTDWEDSNDDNYSETQDLFRLDIPLKSGEITRDREQGRLPVGLFSKSPSFSVQTI